MIPVGAMAHLTWRGLRYAPWLTRALIQAQASGARRLGERTAGRQRTH